MKKGFTFDDVLMVPMYSDILPRNVELSTILTADISLNIPILSAAIDTVTEEEMAKSIARKDRQALQGFPKWPEPPSRSAPSDWWKPRPP